MGGVVEVLPGDKLLLNHISIIYEFINIVPNTIANDNHKSFTILEIIFLGILYSCKNILA